MMTTFRAVVHCDAHLTDRCEGFWKVPLGAGAEAAAAILNRPGWMRVATVRGTHDVCPACRAGGAGAAVPNSVGPGRTR